MENNINALKEWANNMNNNIQSFKNMVDSMVGDLDPESRAKVEEELKNLEKGKANLQKAVNEL
jgi:hypothetical protein